MEHGSEIERLSLRLGTLIRASSVISAVHNATEELILNSIDAQSSSIELYIDFLNHNIKIIDDGAFRKLTFWFVATVYIILSTQESEYHLKSFQVALEIGIIPQNTTVVNTDRKAKQLLH
jgi:hypothetical protein